MKNIITVQHTQSVHHTNGMIGSWTDWDLSDHGREQAETIAQRLSAELGESRYVLFTSDLKRAKQTAAPLAEKLRIQPVKTPVLRERSLGSAVGKSSDWIRANARLPERTVDDRALDDAESRRDVWNRLLPFYRELTESEHENILLVSHGDTLSIFNVLFLGLSPENLNVCDLFGSPGGVSFFRIGEDSRHIIRRHNDMSYVR